MHSKTSDLLPGDDPHGGGHQPRHRQAANAIHVGFWHDLNKIDGSNQARGA